MNSTDFSWLLPSYFTLWLKEYTMKYHQWAAQCKARRDGVGQMGMDWSAPNSVQLSMFYTRAKQTFFTPNACFELRLSSNVLAPFHTSDGSIHPDPVIFTEVAIETRQMLEKSLKMFVQAQLNNVGNNRVLCGILAGFLCTTIGSIPPLAVNFAYGSTRWARLAAFPAMWLGIACMLAALNGVCLGVYIFGDLRQLHKFELARPPISGPQPLRTPWQRPTKGLSKPPQPSNTILPPRLSIIPPSPAHLADHYLSRASTISSQASSGSASSLSASSLSAAGCEAPQTTISISPAYYDADPVDGPATTSPSALEANLSFSEKEKANDQHDGISNPPVTTALFIHPFDSMVDAEYEYDGNDPPEDHQPISPFDFDGLPYRVGHNGPAAQPDTENKKSYFQSSTLPTSFIERWQSRCNRMWRIATNNPPAKSDLTDTPRSSFSDPSITRPQEPHQQAEKGEVAIRKRFKMIQAVPAFSSLTRILSPVIVRGQWEIVVRSTCISLLITWIILGSLLAVPVSH